MKNFKKKSPKVLASCLALLLACCGGAQESGERVHHIFNTGGDRLALATLSLYAPTPTSDHLPQPEFVETTHDDFEDKEKKRLSVANMLSFFDQNNKQEKDRHENESSVENISMSSEKRVTTIEAIANACALLRSFTSDIGPSHVVEYRRQSLMSVGCHLFLSSALSLLPENVDVQCQGLAVLKNLTAGTNPQADKRRDAMADSGVLVLIAKSVNRSFDLSISANKNNTKNNTKKNTNHNENIYFKDYSKISVAAGGEALQTLKNIYDGADRERSLKEKADAQQQVIDNYVLDEKDLINHSETIDTISTMTGLKTSDNGIKKWKKKAIHEKIETAQYKGEPQNKLPVAAVSKGRLESLKRVLTPAEFDNIFFSPLEHHSRVLKGPREPTVPPPPPNIISSTLTQLDKDIQAFRNDNDKDDEDDKNNMNNNSIVVNKNRFIAPKPLPGEGSTMVVDAALENGARSSLAALNVASYVAIGSAVVTSQVGEVASEVITATPKAVEEKYQSVANVSSDAVESVTDQLKIIFA
mmetsp:Transcript_6713/g.8124  ORF Transcript_6713/g.8124 Transcript_6713/m.8124 type:complete len:528 (+) Transcript_6713:3-1586(+)